MAYRAIVMNVRSGDTKVKENLGDSAGGGRGGAGPELIHSEAEETRRSVRGLIPFLYGAHTQRGRGPLTLSPVPPLGDVPGHKQGSEVATARRDARPQQRHPWWWK